ncbi:MAG TPA: NAD-dependent epimerase/dehydratase family protein [Polyangiaceae bacterium]|jgi:UDP-glucose 4-epimerase
MSAPLVWVVGAGGLLGSRVLLELGADGFRAMPPFTWRDRERLHGELRAGLTAFVLRLAQTPGRPWAIAWCAGAGVVATSPADLETETANFGFFLQLLASEPALRRAPGYVLLASSAGGVYGASFACPISESTPVAPGSPYGRAKLAQEELLLSWARSQPGSVSSLVARISNLYGPGQRLSKPQGLISHMSRCLIYGAPVHVYVSLDTIRDYLFAEDAGRRLALGLRQLVREAPREGLHVTKLYASEREVSIAGLLGVFRQIARRKLRVVSGLHAAAALQPRRLQFRSQVWPRDGGRQVELIEGVSRVYRHQLVLFRQGLLPSPPLTIARR